MKLSEADAAVYRLYAVGLLSYEEAMRQAESEVHLRRALLQFDQVARDTSFRRTPDLSQRENPAA
jgi:Tfp pilus assembly ATPase PilU